jgi:putative nucleotidyltransferase with HDIG domain
MPLVAFGGTHMSRGIVLISDRPERGRVLALELKQLGPCRLIGLDEQENASGPLAAIVTDVDFRGSREIERLRLLLCKTRAAGTPILAVLRHDGHAERVQAAALGAASVLPPQTSHAEIAAALASLIGAPPVTQRAAPADLTAEENLKQAGQQFGALFRAAACGEAISRTVVEEATDSVMAAITDGGVRQWLEVVWSYDDATYQHCMLVTGLAAEFASSLRFSRNDQKHLIRGALLHDVGKAKIPLAILNKPARLTPEELEIMRTHAAAGYELLCQQGHYEPELLEVVLRHHEMLDGSGYPDGLAGGQIGDMVRLVTICDIYAALIERRSYKEPMPAARAFKILEDMGGKLERALVRAFAPVAENSAAPVLV